MSQHKVTQRKVQSLNMSTNRFLNYEIDEFNNFQNKLYKEALFGLSNYSQDEIKKLNYQEQNRITKIHRKTQTVLNLWKQELCNNIVNSMLKCLFPKSKVTKELVEDFGNIVDPSFKNFLTFKQLGISKKQIVDKLILKEVLPLNFYKLK
jgi:hypothetical protein